MRRKRWIPLLSLIALFALLPLIGQEGHPLVGTWHGTWGPTGGNQNDATFILMYDGDTISGMVNPGLDVMRIQKATLDASTWTVRIETATKDKVPVVIEGQIQNVTNPRRSIVGTWTQGNQKGALKMVRDN